MNIHSHLYHISQALHETFPDQDRMLQVVLSATAQAVDVPRGLIVLLHPTEHRIDRVYVLASDISGHIDKQRLQTPYHYGLIGHVIYSQRRSIIRDIRTDPRWAVPDGLPLFYATGSAIGAPLIVAGDVRGVMILLHPEVDYFEQERAQLVEDSSHVTSSALNNLQHVNRDPDAVPHYKTLFQDAVVSILLTDFNGYIVDINKKACEFLGYSRNALINVPMHDINIASLHLIDLEDLQEGEERTFRNRAFDLDGKEIPTLVRARRVQVDGRDLVEWVLQDISAQVEVDRLRHDLSAMVYHDLRGPLTNIIAAISRLNDLVEGSETPAVSRLLELGLRSSRQLQRMVDSLLDIQRLEEGNSILNRRPTLIKTIVSDAVALVQPLATDASQSLVSAVAPNLPPVSVDTDMILRVIVNLLENAVKYTPTHGEITLTVQLDANDRDLLITVSDSGPGIPEAMRTQIFDKFSRVAYQDAPKGVGLGLAFCQLAVTAHEGRIWVDSEMGKGSQFRFTLPPMYHGETRDTGTTQPIPYVFDSDDDNGQDDDYATTA